VWIASAFILFMRIMVYFELVSKSNVETPFILWNNLSLSIENKIKK
jgi:hypothetical protein